VYNFSSKSDLIEVSKDIQVKFLAERVDNVYMLRDSELTFGGLQLFSASRLEVVEQSETMMVSISDTQFYPKGKLGLDSARHNRNVQIITFVLEQIVINCAWIK